MDERRALIAAIVANPEEDTPRLALADWLDEHAASDADRARAEFIRLQCRLAALPAGDPERAALEARENELADRHWAEWLGALKPFLTLARRPAFRRGLLVSWHTTPGRFLKKDHQAAVREGFPAVGVGDLHLTGRTKRPALLFESPALAWVPEFHWWNSGAGDEAFRRIAACPHLANLSRLVIEKAHCTDEGLAAVADSAGLPRLRAFGLRDAGYTTTGLLRVLNSDRLPLLDELDLDGPKANTVSYEAVLADPGVSRLKRWRSGTWTPLRAFARCPNLTALEKLVVYDSVMTDADAEALAGNPALRALRVVFLWDLNPNVPPLSPRAEALLRERFGAGLTLRYSALARPPAG